MTLFRGSEDTYVEGQLAIWKGWVTPGLQSYLYAPGVRVHVFRHSEDPLYRMSGIRKGWPMRNHLT